MANLMWCPNCDQDVAPQMPSKGNRGCAVVVLVLISMVVAIFSLPIGGLIFVATIVYLVVGLVIELSNAGLSKPTCPICKGDNLEQ